MAGPLAGVRAVELGLWVAGPSCGGILADWGADVIKVEPLTGDPFRSLAWVYPDQINPPFELDNRGKRSIAVDLSTPQGREVVDRLLAGADVFVTNYRPGGLERAGLDYPSMHERFPHLVYGAVTGYGLDGPQRDKHAYDVGAFWAQAGVAHTLTGPGDDIPYPRGGMGDHMTGMSVAGGIAAALFQRERSGGSGQPGEGQLVVGSLMRTGAYFLGWDHNTTARLDGANVEPTPRGGPPNPLINGYRCGDGQWIWLLGLEGERHWPTTIAALGHPEWADDPRFVSIEDRRDNATALTTLIGEVLDTEPRAHWCDVFDRHDVWWALVQTTAEFHDDPQARAIGCWVDVPATDGGIVEMVASPVDFPDNPWSVQRPVPELGQDTELVLAEHGYDWDEIDRLKDQGVIP